MVEKLYFDSWTDESVRDAKIRSSLRLICILNRYAFTNKRVLRFMRIWERVRIENEMQLLVKELTTIENQYKIVSLLQMNQYCKDRLQGVFYTWLANCCAPDSSLRLQPMRSLS